MPAQLIPATSRGDFGDPDGARTDLKDILDFPTSSFWIGARDFDRGVEANRRIRVVVGMKGSGKTVYLRLLQAAVRNEHAVVLGAIDPSPPSTAQVIETCQLFTAEVLTERWMQIWRCAILSSVATHLLNEKRLKVQVKVDRAEFIEYYGSLFSARRQPTSVYAEVLNVIQRLISSPRQAISYLEDAKWHELQDEIGELLSDLPPLFIFIDAVDEAFANAPMFWMRCQKGLFHQVMRLLRDQRLGGRLHIVVCVRDIVLSSVFRSEHGPRYYGDSHIQVLAWDRMAALSLMNEKISTLGVDLVSSDRDTTNPLGNLLGFEKIRNLQRAVDERVEDYLLRHTFLLPRDIVIMGNQICAELRASKAAGHPISPEQFRDVVARVSRFLGDTRVRECANHIASDQLPAGAARHGYSDFYTASEEYVGGTSESLRSVLRGVGVDRFGTEVLDRLTAAGLETFSGITDVPTVLWQGGLLGYVDDDQSYFFGLRELDRFDLPRETDEYVLHPTLIDVVGLRSIGPPLDPH